MNTQTTQTTQTEPEGKTIAIIAYITLIGFIVALVMNNDKKAPFASYHIRQCLGILLTGLALGVVNVIPFLGLIISFLGSMLLLFMWLMGLINALGGKEKPVPVLGEKYAEWFKGVL